MPKASPTKSTTSTGSNLFVFKYGSKRVMAKRERSYRTAINTCRSLFPNLPQGCTITLNTKDLEICANKMTEISEQIWESVIDQLDCVEVKVEETGHEDTVAVSESSRKKFKITASFGPGEQLQLMVSSSTRIKKVLDTISATQGLCTRDFRFSHRGQDLYDDQDDLVGEHGFFFGDIIECRKVLKGGKPIIYLHSPTLIEVAVKLSLARDWDICAIYPVVPIKPRTASSKEEVSWKVKVHPNGDLTELTTGLDVTYLFWEAHTNPSVSRPETPPPSPGGITPTEDVDAFYPNDADLTENDSVVLPIDKITPYLDKALTALCLHTEARTSFITYWLPSLLKHRHIALRFVPQKSYEHAAPLSVSPTPDVITRIFMVFKGVADDELSQWSAAANRASEDVRMWQDIVGIDSERARDTMLFRVLEWGGMEILQKT